LLTNFNMNFLDFTTYCTLYHSFHLNKNKNKICKIIFFLVCFLPSLHLKLLRYYLYYLYHLPLFLYVILDLTLVHLKKKVAKKYKTIELLIKHSLLY
jgi:hypothetical protein